MVVYQECLTGITKPPTPDIEKYVYDINPTSTTFIFNLDPQIFSTINGPTTHYGVIVTSNQAATAISDQVLTITYDQFKSGVNDTFLALVSSNGLRTRSNDAIQIIIGDGSQTYGYVNGALTATHTYGFAIVTFTQLNISSGLVDVSVSVFAISPYSTVTLQQRPEVIVGSAVGVVASLLFILLLVILIVFWRRHAKKPDGEVPLPILRSKVSIPVRSEDYETYYRKQRADSNCGFAEEFEDLKTVGVAQSKLSALAAENKAKNRYNNVLPYDCSRVKLSVQGSPHDDYINANYMPGYFSKTEYIAAQGPLPGTVNDFWRMIWEKNVYTLVMLTRCQEQGRVKCEEYWPSKAPKHYDNLIVTSTSDIALDDWTIRDFDVKNVKTTETRTIQQFHFTAWPDHGVPESTELLINFRHLVREQMDRFAHNGPTVVHCSAGVGRTGTFIAIDRLIYQIEREGTVDVYGIVHDMRLHRPLMVQTEDQYIFLNQCSMDIIRSRTGTNVDLIYQNMAAFGIYENVQPMLGNPKNGFHKI